MKHEGFTPGPWLAAEEKIREGTPMIAVTAGQYVVAHAPRLPRSLDDISRLIEERANAALIADAPTLLAERDRLREALEAMMYQFDTDEEDYDCIVLARAALAASKGE